MVLSSETSECKQRAPYQDRLTKTSHLAYLGHPGLFLTNRFATEVRNRRANRVATSWSCSRLQGPWRQPGEEGLVFRSQPAAAPSSPHLLHTRLPSRALRQQEEVRDTLSHPGTACLQGPALAKEGRRRSWGYNAPRRTPAPQQLHWAKSQVSPKLHLPRSSQLRKGLFDPRNGRAEGTEWSRSCTLPEEPVTSETALQSPS